MFEIKEDKRVYPRVWKEREQRRRVEEGKNMYETYWKDLEYRE